MALNPSAFALALAHHAAEEAPDSLRAALEKIGAQGDLDEIKLAMAVERDQRLLDSATLWRLLSGYAARDPLAGPILLALVSKLGQGTLDYDPRLRSFVAAAALEGNLEKALVILGKLDRAWLLANPELFGADEATRTSRIAEAMTTLGAAELATFRDELRRVLGTLPPALPVDAMIADRRRAGLV